MKKAGKRLVKQPDDFSNTNIFTYLIQWFCPPLAEGSAMIRRLDPRLSRQNIKLYMSLIHTAFKVRFADPGLDVNGGGWRFYW